VPTTLAPPTTLPRVPRTRARAGAPPPTLVPAPSHPVARVAVDVGLAHLDRPFDYVVPTALDEAAVPGCRVRVRFAGQLTGGFLLGRSDASAHPGQLAFLAGVVSPEPVLAPEVLALARAVADRGAGTLADVLRLAVPPRHARVEAEPAGPGPLPPPAPPEAGSWSRYGGGEAFLAALARGGSPRAVWTALPGATWPAEVAAAVAACLAGSRGALVVVPDGQDLARVDAALAAALGGPGRHVGLAAELGPAERYRRWLRISRGAVGAVVGARAAAFAPVADLGLVVCWDDGNDLHAEPRAPYPHAREVLLQRAHDRGAGALVGGLAPSVEAVTLGASGWARPLAADRATVRRTAPRVEAAGGDAELARDGGAGAARLPRLAFAAAREALGAGTPVLVQVPRRGYHPALACTRCRTPARCAGCRGPLGRAAAGGPLECRWCGRPDAAWACGSCGHGQLRAVVVGAARTAEELGRAFPGARLLTSGRESVLGTVPDEPALVVATPGAEPVCAGPGYGAALLLDGWALLGRADVRAGEEAVRRWCAAAGLVRPGGGVVLLADAAVAAVQALVRWDPAGYASREAAERTALGFPPAVRMAAVDGPAAAVAEVLALAAEAGLPAEADVLGPVPWRLRDGSEGERALVRVPHRSGAALPAALATAQRLRSARKAPDPVRVELDPLLLA